MFLRNFVKKVGTRAKKRDEAGGEGEGGGSEKKANSCSKKPLFCKTSLDNSCLGPIVDRQFVYIAVPDLQFPIFFKHAPHDYRKLRIIVLVALSSKKVETGQAQAMKFVLVLNCKVTFATLFEPQKCGLSHRKTAAFQSTHLIKFRNVLTSLISNNLVFCWRIWTTVVQSSTILLELYKKKKIISCPVTTYLHLQRQSWSNFMFSLWFSFVVIVMVLNLYQLKILVV